MQHTLFNQQTGFYQGKVRDVYYINNQYIVLAASNRISAFDVILPKPIPYKGQVLNQIASYMLQQTAGVCKNWLIHSPTTQTSFGYACKPIKVEVVVRATLTGHAWRTYASGQRLLCGVTLPEGMKQNQFFEAPIITPTTKADAGHDMDISVEEIIAQQLLTQQQWQQVQQKALDLFAFGQKIAQSKGLILADTKYEFGFIQDDLFLMDEIHTPDSSRYFYSENFEALVEAGQAPQQLSKEFVREWLIANNFMGKPNQQVPEMTDEWVNQISQRYIQLYETIIGQKFEPSNLSYEQSLQQTVDYVNHYLQTKA